MTARSAPRPPRLDRATDGLSRRAVEQAEGGLKHGRTVDLFLPAGLGLDRSAAVASARPRRRPPRAGGGSARPGAEAAGSSRCARRLVAGLDGLSLPLPAAEAAGLLALGRGAARLPVHQVPQRADGGRGRAGRSACGFWRRGAEAARPRRRRAGAGGLPGARPGQRARQRPHAQGLRRRLRRLAEVGLEVEILDRDGADAARHERAAGRGAGQRRSRPSSR